MSLTDLAPLPPRPAPAPLDVIDLEPLPPRHGRKAPKVAEAPAETRPLDDVEGRVRTQERRRRSNRQVGSQTAAAGNGTQAPTATPAQAPDAPPQGSAARPAPSTPPNQRAEQAAPARTAEAATSAQAALAQELAMQQRLAAWMDRMLPDPAAATSGAGTASAATPAGARPGPAAAAGEQPALPPPAVPAPAGRSAQPVGRGARMGSTRVAQSPARPRGAPHSAPIDAPAGAGALPRPQLLNVPLDVAQARADSTPDGNGGRGFRLGDIGELNPASSRARRRG